LEDRPRRIERKERAGEEDQKSKSPRKLQPRQFRLIHSNATADIGGIRCELNAFGSFIFLKPAGAIGDETRSATAGCPDFRQSLYRIGGRTGTEMQTAWKRKPPAGAGLELGGVPAPV
jgi:hypothetical protein